MDLIKNYGSYENAKAELEKIKSTKYRNYMYLEEALLEYRRANNIFEVGDCVLPNSNYSDQVHFLFEWYIDGLDFRYKTSSGGWGIIVKACMGNAWRHATDLEIAAGHRL